MLAEGTTAHEASLSDLPVDWEQTQVTSHTITDPEAFLAEMRRTRERGYAINQEESGPVISIAAPILRYDGKPVAAVAVSVAARPGILDAERKQAVAHDVREAARRISFSVGYAANQLV